MREGEWGMEQSPENERDLKQQAEVIGSETEADLEAALGESLFYGELSNAIQDAYDKDRQKDIAMRMPLTEFLKVIDAKREQLSSQTDDEMALNDAFLYGTIEHGIKDVFERYRSVDGDDLSMDMELEDFLKYLDQRSVIAG